MKDIVDVLVSVVIPVYNTEPYLRQCLESIRQQTLRKIEVICVDDGSTDRSCQIITEYTKSDSRFCLVRQENSGPGIARNNGLALVSGKYVIFLDSDDWYETDFLKSMYENITRNNADICICRADEYDNSSNRFYSGTWMLDTECIDGNTLFGPQAISDHIFQFTYGWPWDKLYRTEFIQREELLFPPILNSEDLVFVFESLVAAENICILDKVCVHHRVNRADSVSNTRERQPEAPFQAVEMIYRALKKRDLLNQYQVSFLHWQVNFLIWHISNIVNADLRKKYYSRIRNQCIPEWEKHNAFFACKGDRLTQIKYRLIKLMPCAIFYLTVKCYKVCKRICQ